ncbi:MAG: putative Ig domain-containing protein, partial [Planctomycetota bacterium]
NDILYGDAQDDDLVGGAGHDWISGGAGTDGVIGDEGKIFTSRNVEARNNEPEPFSEPLYAVRKVDDTDETISTPGNLQQAFIHADGDLKKSVDLALTDTGAEKGGNDIIFGGLGDDFLHGGVGNDAISGAEALATIDNNGRVFFDDPTGWIHELNETDRPNATLTEPAGGWGQLLDFGFIDVLKMTSDTEFAEYDEFNPLRKIKLENVNDELVLLEDATQGTDFLLNFDAFDPENMSVEEDDGRDALFGHVGNDWLVGGTNNDYLFGGYGHDVHNADDNHETDGGQNQSPDEFVDDGFHTTNSDHAYGGAGVDILIANTGRDRLIDWVGEFNSYLVPFAPFGAFTISRSLQPQLREFLYDLSESYGADQRNGEPYGELGVVEQQDPDWQDQTGAPRDVQPGNIPGGARDIIRESNFSSLTDSEGFAADSGRWEISRGTLRVAPEVVGSDAVSVYFLDQMLPNYFELLLTAMAEKPIAGYKANAYLIFDYQSKTDFKFAGLNAAIDKLQIGHRTPEAWVVDAQVPAQIWHDQTYNFKVALHGATATLVVNESITFSHTFEPRVENGFSYGLNTGMVGVGADNSIGRFDNIKAQVLPPEITFDYVEDFNDSAPELFDPQDGQWNVVLDRYEGAATTDVPAISLFGLDTPLAPASLLELQTTLNTDRLGGIVFDYVNPTRFKFAAITPQTGQLVVGHLDNRGWSVEASADLGLQPGVDYTLDFSLKGTSIAIEIDDQAALSHVFNGLLSDGAFGLITDELGASYDSFKIRTDDHHYRDVAAAVAQALTESPIPNQLAIVPEGFEFALPVGDPADVDTNELLSVTVTQSNGDPLPQWLQVDGSSQLLYVAPGAGDVGALSLTVTTSYLEEETASTTFDLELADPITADFNLDGQVNVADLIVWASGFGSGRSFTSGDANFDRQVGVADLLLWASNFGASASAAPAILTTNSAAVAAATETNTDDSGSEVSTDSTNDANLILVDTDPTAYLVSLSTDQPDRWDGVTSLLKLEYNSFSARSVTLHQEIKPLKL